MLLNVKIVKVQDFRMASKINPEGLFGRITSAKLAKYIGKTIEIDIPDEGGINKE